MEIIFIAFVYLMGVAVGVWIGFSKRERDFQNKPIQFVIGNSPSVWVKNQGTPRTIIEIQNPSLVDIRKKP